MCQGVERVGGGGLVAVAVAVRAHARPVDALEDDPGARVDRHLALAVTVVVVDAPIIGGMLIDIVPAGGLGVKDDRGTVVPFIAQVAGPALAELLRDTLAGAPARAQAPLPHPRIPPHALHHS